MTLLEFGLKTVLHSINFSIRSTQKLKLRDHDEP